MAPGVTVAVGRDVLVPAACVDGAVVVDGVVPFDGVGTVAPPGSVIGVAERYAVALTVALTSGKPLRLSWRFTLSTVISRPRTVTLSPFVVVNELMRSSSFVSEK